MNQYLRKGVVASDLQLALGGTIADGSFYKYNPNHDPQNGQFTSGPASGGTGSTATDAQPHRNPAVAVQRRLTFEQVSPIISANNISGQSDELVMAIAYRESKFDPLAVPNKPHASALGLMQVEKGALEDYNKFYSPKYSHDQLTDPAINVRVGSGYLGLVINRYQRGNVRRGLIHYGNGSTSYADNLLKAEAALRLDKRSARPQGPQKILQAMFGK